MFSGIIENTGRVIKLAKSKGGWSLAIKSANNINKIKVGDSVNVDGVCLTTSKILRNELEFQVMPRTIGITIIKNYQPQQLVNIETALVYNEKINGHLVTGHIDGIATVRAINKKNKDYNLIVDLPRELSNYMIKKGSVAINGVSLTVAEKIGDTITTSLTPYTLTHTNLGKLKPADPVNIEVDLIIKYLKKV